MNTNPYTENTIVCFHVGRGGRFYNPGHLTFEGTRKIAETSAYEHLFPPTYKNGNENLRSLKAEFRDGNGNTVELTNEMVRTGVGIINLDGEFDTTYTRRLKDLSEKETEAILNTNVWDSQYLKEILIQIGLVEPEENEE